MSDILERIQARRASKPSIPIDVPEWGLSAFVRPISAGKMAALQKQGNSAIVAAQIIIHGIVGKDGKAIFEDDADTLATLTGEEYDLIDRVSAEIARAKTTVGSADSAKNS